MTFSTGLLILARRSLWASWRYATTEPSLFGRHPPHRGTRLQDHDLHQIKSTTHVLSPSPI